MKPIIITAYLLSMFSSLFAQIDVAMPTCNEEEMKELQAQVIQSMKVGKKSSEKELFPQDLYKEKIVVFILDRGFENIESLIQNEKKKESTYSFEKTVSAAKEACGKAGLNVLEYHLVMNGKNHFGDQVKGAIEVNEELKAEAFEKRVPYILQISKSSIEGEYNLVLVDKENTFQIVSPLNALYNSRYANTGDSNEGITIDHLGPEAKFGGQYGVPTNIENSTIYYINAANIILPPKKPKGLCKHTYYMYEGIKKENNERNIAVAKVFPKCDVPTEIVDEDSDVPTKEDVYLLKYFEYKNKIGDHQGQALYSSTEVLYLENTLTKRVYALDGEKSNFEKYLEKAIESINKQ